MSELGSYKEHVDPARPSNVTVRVGMNVWEDQVQMELTLPAAPVRLESLLPVFHQISDGLVDLAAQRAEAGGRTISCAKGCGACCRQLVPISEAEARRIARLVEMLPEPRRGEIRARFAEAARRLADAGLLDKLREPGGWEKQDVKAIGLSYFRLGVPCPFLEEESCSIHAERPITCREYLVTSPAVNCSNPTPQNIDWVEIPSKVWTAIARADARAPVGRFIPWVPLVLAPEWAELHPDRSSPEPPEQLVRRVFQELSRQAGAGDIPDPRPE